MLVPQKYEAAFNINNNKRNVSWAEISNKILNRQAPLTFFFPIMFPVLTFQWVAPGCKEKQLQNVTSVQTSWFTSHTTLIIESLDVAWVSALKLAWAQSQTGLWKLTFEVSVWIIDQRLLTPQWSLERCAEFNMTVLFFWETLSTLSKAFEDGFSQTH